MKLFFKPVLLAGLLTAAAFAAFAQTPAPADHAGMMGAGGPMMHDEMGHERMGRMDPAKMQAWMDKRLAALKAKLKLTAAQEGAWSTFTAAMKPTGAMLAKRPDYAELAKLPTPERIDKMKALHTQHISEMTAAMDQRGEATKAFYATLTPEQKKVFDDNAMRRPGHRGWMAGHRDGKGAVPPKQ